MSLISGIPDNLTITIGNWQGVLQKDGDIQELRKSYEEHVDNSLKEKLSSLIVPKKLRIRAGLGGVGAIAPLIDWKGTMNVVQWIKDMNHTGGPSPGMVTLTPMDVGIMSVGLLGMIVLGVSIKKIHSIKRERKKTLLEMNELKEKFLKHFDNISEEFKAFQGTFHWADKMKDVLDKKLIDIETPSSQETIATRDQQDDKRQRRLFEGSLPDWSPLPPQIESR